jgi:aminopeptidase N
MRRIGLFVFFSLCVLMVFGQYRSDSLHVAHYDIALNIDPYGQTISGTTTLQIVPKMGNLSSFNLDLRNMTIDSIMMNQTLSSYTYVGDLLSIPANTYNLGDTIEIAVSYHGTPYGNSWGGFTFINNYTFNIGVSMYEQPHCFGRVWFPCIDEFTDKATYSCHIGTYPYHTAVCGGQYLGESAGEYGTKIWHWQLDQPIPTYLASVATGAYQLYTDTFHGMEADIPITIYSPSSYINNVPASFVHLHEIAANYEHFYGPLRFPRIGYVLVNFTSGAMEHATNIALPQVAIDGTTGYESTIAHELSHSWFGNLITCEKAEEMWINEGFASYSEALTDEGVYSKEKYKQTINNQHFDVLKNLYARDQGYYALNNIPQNHTYGMHAYDKGSIVVHTLRHYMGDSLFFGGIQAMLNQYAFQNMNSVQVFDFLSDYSGINMNGFYEGWINQPGFLHFSIDSIVAEGGNQYAIHLRQRLLHADHYADDNRINLTFFSADGQRYDYHHAQFSGATGIIHINIPFTPLFGVADYDNEICDAIIDYNHCFTYSSGKSFTNANVTANITALQDSILMRVEYNLVHADPFKVQPDPSYRLNNRYWRIEYTHNDQAQGTLKFNYNGSNSSQPDYELLQGHTPDELALFYRRNCADDWHSIPFSRSGQMSGTITTESLLPGEYTLGVPGSDVGIKDRNDNGILIYPNPADSRLYITSERPIDSIVIYDINGREVMRQTCNDNMSSINIQSLSAGSYIINLLHHNQLLKSDKFIKH